MRVGLAAIGLLALLLPPSHARAELLQDVRARGTLKVGMVESPPWMSRDAGGQPVGLEVEFVKRLAADLGVQLDVVTAPVDALMDRLAAHELDIAAANLAITPKRALQVAFTQPYGISDIRPVVRRDKFDEDVTPEALNAATVTIAVVTGTAGADTAAEQFAQAKIEPFPTQAAAEQALLAGSVTALVGSTPFPELLSENNPDLLMIAGDQPLRTTVEAFAVPQGEPTYLTFLNNWIDAVTAEGFIDATRQRWFATIAPPAAVNPPTP